MRVWILTHVLTTGIVESDEGYISENGCFYSNVGVFKVYTKNQYAATLEEAIQYLKTTRSTIDNQLTLLESSISDIIPESGTAQPTDNTEV